MQAALQDVSLPSPGIDGKNGDVALTQPPIARSEPHKKGSQSAVFSVALSLPEDGGWESTERE